MNTYLIPIVAGYFIGSVSFAYWICKAKGVDILTFGSGNAGATNVKRALGAYWARLVFLLDFMKGIIAVYAGVQLTDTLEGGIVCLLAAVIGHSFSPWIRFKGGKGVATTMGGLLLLAPLSLFVGMLTWLFVFFMTRYVSVASMIFGLVVPMATYILGYPAEVVTFTVALMALNITLHFKNLRRLWMGTESKFSRS